MQASRRRADHQSIFKWRAVAPGTLLSATP
jgi:hypothetical protein